MHTLLSFNFCIGGNYSSSFTIDFIPNLRDGSRSRFFSVEILVATFVLFRFLIIFWSNSNNVFGKFGKYWIVLLKLELPARLPRLRDNILTRL